MRKLFLMLTLLSTMVVFAKSPKILQGSFEILRNEKFIGTEVDFSKAKFDGRDLEAHLYSMNIDSASWLIFEEQCAVTINMSYAYSTHRGITLGLKGVKDTKYYLLIQPLEMDMDDGECDVEVTLKDSKTDEVLAIATGRSEGVDLAFTNAFTSRYTGHHEEKNVANWEYNVLHAMVSIGKGTVFDLCFFW